jgi:hypothetical protein
MILRIDDIIASRSSPMPEYGSGDDMPSFDDD